MPAALCVPIDPVRTRQIVLPPLANAIKFASAGSIALRVVYLDGKPRHASPLAIRVRDTGTGIPPDRQRRILAPHRASSGRAAAA